MYRPLFIHQFHCISARTSIVVKELDPAPPADLTCHISVCIATRQARGCGLYVGSPTNCEVAQVAAGVVVLSCVCVPRLVLDIGLIGLPVPINQLVADHTSWCRLASLVAAFCTYMASVNRKSGDGMPLKCFFNPECLDTIKALGTVLGHLARAWIRDSLD